MDSILDVILMWHLIIEYIQIKKNNKETHMGLL
jgi:hypothetical protein